jgi:hypothetical protein
MLCLERHSDLHSALAGFVWTSEWHKDEVLVCDSVANSCRVGGGGLQLANERMVARKSGHIKVLIPVLL